MSKLKFTIRNTSAESTKNIEKVVSVITNADSSTLTEEHTLNTSLAPSETLSFYSSIDSSLADSIVKSNLEIFYKNIQTTEE